MRFLKYWLIPILFFSCENDLEKILLPLPDETAIPKDVFPISQTAKYNIEGVYQVSHGKNTFGDDLILKWSGEYLSVFSGKSAAYFILDSGYKDSVIYFGGYWRMATGSATGLANFKIEKMDGAGPLLSNLRPDSIVIKGLYGSENNSPSKKLVFKYVYPLKKDSSDFYIIGHRGGGRNVDRLPYSENSLEMIKFAERLGANAVELDVRRTGDGVLVLFHDTYMNNRLINEDYFIGKISDYTFAQLRTFCTLTNGERIPTLEEALHTIIEKTQLKLVWLDIKTPKSLPDVISLQRQYHEMAADFNRDLEILIGIPDKDILERFLNFSNFENIPSLCELKTKDVIQSDALVWAPRWSLGLLNQEVAEMHALGKRVFVWTLDDQVLIKKYLKEGNFDGYVTNYPSLTAYEYFRKK